MGGNSMRWVAFVVATICVIGIFVVETASSQQPVSVRNGLAAREADGNVWVIPVNGTIDIGLAEYVKRVVTEATVNNAALIVLELNTLGGRVDAATEIRDALLATPLPTLAYVTGRAISAGALIAISADYLVMAPGATIGAAQPQPLDEKTVSYVRAEFAATAERQGRDPEVAAAMVDARVAIDGVTAAGQILTLSAHRALQLGFIDATAETRDEALAALGYVASVVVEPRVSWAEAVVRFLTDPVVAQLLLALGFLGLLAEVTSPGWGVPGTMGVIALALFFGSRLFVGLIGVETLILFLAGVVLLLVEVFVIPGFGLVGILGLIAMGAGVFLSFPDPANAIQALAVTLVIVAATTMIFLRRFQKASLWGNLVLRQQQGGSAYRLTDEAAKVGDEGVVFTPLRPAGKVEIDGIYYDVVSEGQMVKQGTKVRIVRVQGSRIVVRPIADED